MKHLKHLKYRHATCSFSATSPYCMQMEACRRVEFTDVDLAAPVEKATTGPLEKAAAWWTGRKMGCCASSGTVEMPPGGAEVRWRA